MPTATIIGSGHNGLSAAIVLAAARVSITVFERNVQTGSTHLVLLMKRSAAQKGQHIAAE